MQQTCSNKGDYIMKTTTATARVREAFLNGETLTAGQIRARFGVANPHNVVYSLRRQGYAIHLNEGRVGSKGRRKADFYRLGMPTRAVIAAGYRAMTAA